MSDNGRFTARNEGFICENCSKSVPPATKSYRNHCPFCLTSKHVDVFPGDRANPCRGLMKATSYEVTGRKGIVIEFICQQCGQSSRNISSYGQPGVGDYLDAILQLGNA